MSGTRPWVQTIELDQSMMACLIWSEFVRQQPVGPRAGKPNQGSGSKNKKSVRARRRLLSRFYGQRNGKPLPPVIQLPDVQAMPVPVMYQPLAPA